MKAALLVILAGCASSAQAGSCLDKHARDPTFVQLAVPDNAPRPADASAFSIVETTTTVDELSKKIGPPDGSMGSDRITILVWCVPDGEVRVSTRDGSTIESVRHNGKVVYERKKK